MSKVNTFYPYYFKITYNDRDTASYILSFIKENIKLANYPDYQETEEGYDVYIYKDIMDDIPELNKLIREYKDYEINKNIIIDFGLNDKKYNKLYNSKESSDVKIIVNDNTIFYAHKSVLTLLSKYFRIHINHFATPSTYIDIYLNDINASVFELLLKSLYGKTIIGTVLEILELIKLFNFFLIDISIKDDLIKDVLSYIVDPNDIYYANDLIGLIYHQNVPKNIQNILNDLNEYAEELEKYDYF